MALQKLVELIELPDAVVYGVASAADCVFGPLVAPFGAALNSALPEQMAALNGWVKTHKHPLSAKLPLMQAESVLFAAVAYLVVIAALYPLGQALGKLEIKKFTLVHNTFLFLLSLYMWSSIALTAAASYSSLWNIGVDAAAPNAWRMAKLIWLFYVSKLPEFVDTVIMMLKHNYRQVSFLHMYHHCTIFIIWFAVTLEGPGGDAYWSAQLNSLVHVFMYFYYAATVVAGVDGPLRRFLNRIKFVVTKGQMFQFSLNCVQSGYLMWVAATREYPPHLIQLLFYYMLTLLALFGNFLLQNEGADGAKKGGRTANGAPAAAADNGAEPRKSGSVDGAGAAAAAPAAEAGARKAGAGRAKKEH